MTLSPFKEKEGAVSPLQPILNAVRRLTERKRNRYDKKEFFNGDGTKKFIVLADPDSIQDYKYHEVSLNCKGFVMGWISMMGLVRREIDGKTTYVLSIDAIADDEPLWTTRNFEYDTDGNLSTSNMLSWTPKDRDRRSQVEKAKNYLHNMGCFHKTNLPPRINFGETAKQFLSQAKELNFQTPSLIPYKEPKRLENGLE